MVPTPMTRHSTRASSVKLGPRIAMPWDMFSLTSSYTQEPWHKSATLQMHSSVEWTDLTLVTVHKKNNCPIKPILPESLSWGQIWPMQKLWTGQWAGERTAGLHCRDTRQTSIRERLYLHCCSPLLSFKTLLVIFFNPPYKLSFADRLYTLW